MPAVTGLLRTLNRALRGKLSGAGRRGALGAKRKSKKRQNTLSVRIDQLPAVQAAVKKAGPGAKVVSAKVVTGSETSRQVFTRLKEEVRKPTYKFIRETPSSAKGRLRKSVYNQWYAEQVIAAKRYADNTRRRLRRQLGRVPTKNEMNIELRKNPFVSEPMPLVLGGKVGNLAETRGILKSALPVDIPLAPLKFKNTKQAIEAIYELPDAVRNKWLRGLTPKARDDLIAQIKKFEKDGKEWSVKVRDHLSAVMTQITAKPITVAQKATGLQIKRRVARAEARVQTGTTIDPDVRKGAAPAQYGEVTKRTRKPAAVEVEIKDAAGTITTERISLSDVASADPAVKRHHTRVGKRVVEAREAKMFKPGDRVDLDDMDVLDEIAEGFGEVDFQTQGSWVSRNKGLTALLGVDALAIGSPMIASVAGGFQEDFTGENFSDSRKGLKFRMEQQDRIVRQEAHSKSQTLLLQNLMAQNMGRLAAVAPHIYNQVLAGQHIPQGGVVIGGQPRTDLMEQLAYDMSTGGFPNQQSQAAMLQSYAQ